MVNVINLFNATRYNIRFSVFWIEHPNFVIFYGQIHRKVTEIFVDRITLKLQTTTCTPFQCDQMAKLFKVFGNQQE